MKVPSIRTLLGLAGLVALGWVLRTWGNGWGLPNESRFYPYHPDEPVLLLAAQRINPLWGDFLPGFYNYGTLYLTLSRLCHDFASVFFAWRPVPPPGEPLAGKTLELAQFFLAGRWVSAGLGTLSIVATWWLGRTVVGERGGWWAALMVAVAPMPVILAHFMTVDIAATAFTTLALAAACAAWTAVTPKRKLNLLCLGAVAAGLAAGTKYNCFPVLLPVLTSALFRTGSASKIRPGLAVIGLTGLFGVVFLLTTPGALLETRTFLSQVGYELERNREGQGLVFRATPPALLYHLGISLPVGLEWPGFLLALAGLLIGAWGGRDRWRDSPGTALVLLFVLTYGGLLLGAERKFLRYVAPILPAVTVLGALALARLELRSRPGSTLLAVGAVLAAFASTCAHLGLLQAPDVRDLAAEYLKRNASGAVVVLASDPWYYTPPLTPEIGCVKASVAYGGPSRWASSDGQMVVADAGGITAAAPAAGTITADELRRMAGALVVWSDFEYEDSLRVQAAEPNYTDGVTALNQELSQSVLEREFRPRPTFGPFTWWSTGTPPHDWRYFMPTIRIYRTPLSP